MPRIRGTTMDISFAFAIFCMPIIQLVTYIVNGHALDSRHRHKNKLTQHVPPAPGFAKTWAPVFNY